MTSLYNQNFSLFFCSESLLSCLSIYVLRIKIFGNGLILSRFHLLFFTDLAAYEIEAAVRGNSVESADDRASKTVCVCAMFVNQTSAIRTSSKALIGRRIFNLFCTTLSIRFLERLKTAIGGYLKTSNIFRIV